MGHHWLELDFRGPNNTRPPNTFISGPRIVSVRNPYKRIVSMFTNKICKRIETEPDKLRLKINLTTITFRNFVKILLDIKQKSGLDTINDTHVLPQVYDFTNNDNTTLKLEDFSNSITSIYGIRIIQIT